MRLADFEAMVRRMAGEVPAEFLEGIAEIVVSPRTRPHPERAEIFTLGECIPLPQTSDHADEVQSRVVLYHGSFAALAQLDDDFDWSDEAWETLTHELRHHLEWRARAPDLEAFDDAAEQNFARHDGEAFDASFYLDGVPAGDDAWRIDDDVFIERQVGRGALPAEVGFDWQGRSYRVALDPGLPLPAFLTLSGVADAPPGELVLVVRRRPGLLGLLGGAREPFQGTAAARPAGSVSD